MVRHLTLFLVEALVVLIVFHWLVVFARNFDEKSCLVIQIGELQLVTRLVSSRQNRFKAHLSWLPCLYIYRHFCQWNHTHWSFQLRVLALPRSKKLMERLGRWCRLHFCQDEPNAADSCDEEAEAQRGNSPSLGSSGGKILEDTMCVQIL